MNTEEYKAFRESLAFLNSNQSKETIKELFGMITFDDRVELENYILKEIKDHEANKKVDKETNRLFINQAKPPLPF